MKSRFQLSDQDEEDWRKNPTKKKKKPKQEDQPPQNIQNLLKAQHQQELELGQELQTKKDKFLLEQSFNSHASSLDDKYKIDKFFEQNIDFQLNNRDEDQNSFKDFLDNVSQNFNVEDYKNNDFFDQNFLNGGRQWYAKTNKQCLEEFNNLDLEKYAFESQSPQKNTQNQNKTKRKRVTITRNKGQQTKKRGTRKKLNRNLNEVFDDIIDQDPYQYQDPDFGKMDFLDSMLEMSYNLASISQDQDSFSQSLQTFSFQSQRSFHFFNTQINHFYNNNNNNQFKKNNITHLKSLNQFLNPEKDPCKEIQTLLRSIKKENLYTLQNLSPPQFFLSDEQIQDPIDELRLQESYQMQQQQNDFTFDKKSKNSSSLVDQSSSFLNTSHSDIFKSMFNNQEMQQQNTDIINEENLIQDTSTIQNINNGQFDTGLNNLTITEHPDTENLTSNLVQCQKKFEIPTSAQQLLKDIDKGKKIGRLQTYDKNWVKLDDICGKLKQKESNSKGEKFYNLLILHADGKVIMKDTNPLEQNGVEFSQIYVYKV